MTSLEEDIRQRPVTDVELACNLCGSRRSDELFAAGEAQVSRIVKCADCGLMFASPRARGADVDNIETWDPSWKLLERNVQRQEKEALQVSDYDDTREALNELYPERGTLVEVGGGLGFLLDRFRNDGWQVISIEPWVEACTFARERFGIDARPTTLEKADLDADSVDVIVLLHVIEHVPDPAATLREAHRVLRPGGHMVLETPRYDGLSFKLLGKRERSLSCDGHIYFFTDDTLRRMVGDAGFEVVESRFVGRHLTLDRLVWNLGTITKSARVLDWLMRMSSRLRLNTRSVHVNVRDMQRLVLHKPARHG